jgi:hypothetical protein
MLCSKDTTMINSSTLYASPQLLKYKNFTVPLNEFSSENWGKMDVYSIGVIILRIFNVDIRDIMKIKYLVDNEYEIKLK